MTKNTFKVIQNDSIPPEIPRGEEKSFKAKTINSESKKSKANSWFKGIIRKFLWKLTKVFIGLFLISILAVVVTKYVPIWFTPTMIDRKITAIQEDEDSEIFSDWEPIENISTEARLAVVAAEDQLFPTHNGFDFDSMWSAFQNNRKGKKIKGASTISQQVAKNVFLWQGRSYLRKGLEAYFTFLIEIIWGKERILEVYLNVAEMGKMTFGIEAASQLYYNHSSEAMSRNEAAKIAAVLPNPVRFSVKNPTNYINKRTNFIMRQMRRLGGKAYLSHL